MKAFRINVSNQEERERVINYGKELGYEQLRGYDDSRAAVLFMEDDGKIRSLTERIEEFCNGIPEGEGFKQICYKNELISIEDFIKLEALEC